MAEVILRKLIAEKLHCRDWELRERRIDVFSAGIAAADNDPASSEAIRVMQEHGLDLSQHLSQRVTDHMLENSTWILTMTNRHRAILCEARPDLSDRIHTVSRIGEDISDPIGGAAQDYRDCAAQITSSLHSWIADIFGGDSKTR